MFVKNKMLLARRVEYGDVTPTSTACVRYVCRQFMYPIALMCLMFPKMLEII